MPRIPGPLGLHDPFTNDPDHNRGVDMRPLGVNFRSWLPMDLIYDTVRRKTRLILSPGLVDKLNIHIYQNFSTDGTYEASNYLTWLLTTQFMDERTGALNLLESIGIQVNFFLNKSHGVTDLEQSLQASRAIVLCLCHDWQDTNNDRHSGGLTPQGIERTIHPEIPSAKLRHMLQQSNAQLVIIGSCDSSYAVGHLTAGPAVVAVDSRETTRKSNKKTRESFVIDYAFAAGILLFSMIGIQIG